MSAKQIIREYAKAGQQGWLAVIRDDSSVKTGLLAINQANQQDNDSQDAGQLQQGLTDLLSEFGYVFESLGSPHPCKLKHRIALEDEHKQAPRTCQYRMSLAEQAKIKR